MKITTLILTLLVSTQTFANYPLHFGKIRNVWPYSGEWLEDMGEYRITKVKAVTTAKARGSKIFGKWKNCYASRYENVPRSPFNPKYIYTSKSSFQVLESEILADNEILLGDIKKNHDLVSKQLRKETKNKCKIKTTTKFVVEFFLVKSGNHLKYQFFIDENEGAKSFVIKNHRFNEQGNLDEDTYLLEEGVSQGPLEMATYTYQGSF
jgi:hypothetical protein